MSKRTGYQSQRNLPKAIDKDLGALTERFDEMSEQVEHLKNDVRQLVDFVGQMANGLTGALGQIAQLQSQIAANVTTGASASDLTEMQSMAASIEKTLADLQTKFPQFSARVSAQVNSQPAIAADNSAAPVSAPDSTVPPVAQPVVAQVDTPVPAPATPIAPPADPAAVQQAPVVDPAQIAQPDVQAPAATPVDPQLTQPQPVQPAAAEVAQPVVTQPAAAQ